MKAVSLLLFACGLGLAGASTAADLWGGYAGWGPLQIAGIVAGGFLVFLGAIIAFQRSRACLKRFLATGTSLVIFSVCFGLAIAEIALRLWEGGSGNASYFVEREQLSKLIPDENLLHKIPANTYGHDADGFRNVRVPEQTDIVAIGDSWTWGVNAERSQSWPSRLAALTGKNVYNMGMGGYGPAQYWFLNKRSKSLSPELVVIGLYLGNDMIDAENVVYRLDAYADFRDPTYAASDKEYKVGEKIRELNRLKKEWISKRMAKQARETLSGWAGLLLRYSAVARLAARAELAPVTTLKELEFMAFKDWARQAPDHTIVIDGKYLKTILHPSEHLFAVDLDNPRIREGVALTKKILLSLRQSLEAEGTGLLILILPSKELAFAHIVMKQGQPVGEMFSKAVRMEERIREDLFSFMELNKIAMIDALPVLRDAVESGVDVFPKDGDTHPLPAGYRLIAEKVYEKLR